MDVVPPASGGWITDVDGNGYVDLARACTGRDVVVKFSGCYHGHAVVMLVHPDVVRAVRDAARRLTSGPFT